MRAQFICGLLLPRGCRFDFDLIASNLLQHVNGGGA